MILSQYFKAIEREANLDPTEYKSIAELTKEIAIRAGWTRQVITQKNGKQVIKTVYTNRKTVTVRKNGKLEEVSAINYDSILCAKWYMYFKKHFMFKKKKQKNLNEYFDYILTETFHAVFSSLDLNKNITDASITNLVKLAFASRTGIAIWEHGSDRKRQAVKNRDALKAGKLTEEEVREQGLEIARNGRPICRMNNVLGTSLSIEGLKEIGMQIEDKTTYSPDDMNSLIIDIKDKLKNNDLGLRLLEVMLTTRQIREVDPEKVKAGKQRPETPDDRGYIDPNNIVNLMKFEKDELSKSNISNTVEQLTSAYKIIRRELLESLRLSGVDITKYIGVNTNPEFNLTRRDRAQEKIDKCRQANEECSLSM